MIKYKLFPKIEEVFVTVTNHHKVVFFPLIRTNLESIGKGKGMVRFVSYFGNGEETENKSNFTPLLFIYKNIVTNLRNRMRKKKNLIIVLILLIGILSFYGFKNYAEKVKDKHCLATQISSRLFDFNTFELKVDSTLNLSDFKVVNQNSGKTIFENGKSRKGIKNEYGHCIFELFWKGKQVYEFGHFKMNNWNTNKYKLNIRMENNELKPNLEIYGPDRRKADSYFRKITE